MFKLYEGSDKQETLKNFRVPMELVRASAVLAIKFGMEFHVIKSRYDLKLPNDKLIAVFFDSEMELDNKNIQVIGCMPSFGSYQEEIRWSKEYTDKIVIIAYPSEGSLTGDKLIKRLTENFFESRWEFMKSVAHDSEDDWFVDGAGLYIKHMKCFIPNYILEISVPAVELKDVDATSAYIANKEIKSDEIKYLWKAIGAIDAGQGVIFERETPAERDVIIYTGDGRFIKIDSKVWYRAKDCITNLTRGVKAQVNRGTEKTSMLSKRVFPIIEEVQDEHTLAVMKQIVGHGKKRE